MRVAGELAEGKRGQLVEARRVAHDGRDGVEHLRVHGPERDRGRPQVATRSDVATRLRFVAFGHKFQQLFRGRHSSHALFQRNGSGVRFIVEFGIVPEIAVLVDFSVEGHVVAADVCLFLQQTCHIVRFY